MSIKIVAAPIATALDLAQLGDRLSSLRLRSPDSLRAVEHSLSRDGQLVAVVCHRHADVVEIVDGFKHLVSARKLGWATLRAEVHEVAGPAAKLLLWQSNARQELTALGEGGACAPRYSPRSHTRARRRRRVYDARR